MTEQEFADLIGRALEEYAEAHPDELGVYGFLSFEDRGLMTNDKGVAVMLEENDDEWQVAVNVKRAH